MLYNDKRWVTMDFRNKLVYVRATLNLTQTELDKELNVSFTTINRWETGKIKPSKKAEMLLEIFCKKKEIVPLDKDN